MTAVLNNRIILKDGPTLTELSVDLADFTSTGTSVALTSSQELFIGSLLPFNHRYFKISASNSNASVLSIAMWDGDDFKDSAGTLDQTSVSGVSFAQSGIISWEKDKDEGWAREDTDDMDGSGLETLKIYGLYWAKITVSADFSGGTAIDYVGWKFSKDADLEVKYPDLNTSDVKAQFKSGKTDWDDQHFAAADHIIRVLQLARAEDFITPNQILRWEHFLEAAVHWVARIIYNSHGKDGIENRDSASDDFDEAMKIVNIHIDMNANTHLDNNEVIPSFDVNRR